MFNQTGPQWGSEFLVCGNKNCFWSWTACYAEIPLLLPTGHWLSLGDGGDTGAHGDKHSLWMRPFFVVGSPLLVGDRVLPWLDACFGRFSLASDTNCLVFFCVRGTEVMWRKTALPWLFIVSGVSINLSFRYCVAHLLLVVFPFDLSA